MTKSHSIKFQRTNKGKHLTIPDTVSKKAYIGIIRFENIKYLWPILVITLAELNQPCLKFSTLDHLQVSASITFW